MANAVINVKIEDEENRKFQVTLSPNDDVEVRTRPR